MFLDIRHKLYLWVINRLHRIRVKFGDWLEKLDKDNFDTWR